MKHIILLSAPPQAGKDTVANIIVESFSTKKPIGHLKFSKPLKEMTHRLYGQDHPHDYYELSKDTPHDDFLGITPRQAYIGVSEQYMKPMHGKAVWAKMLAREIRTSPLNYFVISDLGFIEEFSHLYGYLDFDLSVIHLARKDCNFDNDSRSYIYAPVNIHLINNNGSLEDLRAIVTATVAGNIWKELSWQKTQ